MQAAGALPGRLQVEFSEQARECGHARDSRGHFDKSKQKGKEFTAGAADDRSVREEVEDQMSGFRYRLQRCRAWKVLARAKSLFISKQL